MNKKRLLSLLLAVVMLAGLYVPAVNAATNSLTLVSGILNSNGVYDAETVYADYMDTELTTIDAGSTYEWTSSGVEDHNGTLNDGSVVWLKSTGWNYQYNLGNGSYTVRFDLKRNYNISRVDVHEIGYTADTDGNTTQGVGNVSIKVGATTDAMTDATITLTDVVAAESAKYNAEHANSRANIATLDTALEGRYVDVTITTVSKAFIPEIMIFGDLAPENLTLLNSPVGTNSGLFGNSDVYPLEGYLYANITSINAGATYKLLPNTKSSDSVAENDVVSGYSETKAGALNEGTVIWCPTGWGFDNTLSNPNLTYTFRFDLKTNFNIERVDVHETGVSSTRGINNIDIAVGTTEDNVTAVESSSSSVVADTTNTNLTGAKTNIERLSAPTVGRYVDVTISVTSAASLLEISIFGSNTTKGRIAALNGSPNMNTSIYGNVDVFANIFNLDLTTINMEATYSFSGDATVTSDTNGTLLSNGETWCPSSWSGKTVTIDTTNGSAVLTYDLGDSYQVEKVAVFETNHSSTDSLASLSVKVGDTLDSLADAPTGAINRYSAASRNASTSGGQRGNWVELTTPATGRYVQLVMTGSPRITAQEVIILGKPVAKQLKVISGGVQTGLQTLYANMFDGAISLVSASKGATYSYELATDGQANADADCTGMNNGNPDENRWYTYSDANPDYMLTYDLKDKFLVESVVIVEPASGGTSREWNFLNPKNTTVYVGDSTDALTQAEVSYVTSINTDTTQHNGPRLTTIKLANPTYAQYVKINIDVGGSVRMGEIFVTGEPYVEPATVNLISGNTLTDADKEWYSANHKINITPLSIGTTYRWFNDTIAALDDDYNSDGVGGEKNIADGNITSADSQYVVPATVGGAVVYDFGKKMAVSRIDIHELVKNDTGIGTITIKKGDKLGSINSTVKTVTLTQPTAEELTHQLDVIDLGAPVETQFLSITFGLSDGNDATTDFTKYILGDILIFGEESEVAEYTLLKSLSGQSWTSGNLQYYQENGYTVEAIDTGMTAEWATNADCASITYDTHVNLVTNVLHGSFNTTATSDWIGDAVFGATLDLKAPRTVSRVDIGYNENSSNGFKSISVYASNTKAELYADSNLVQTFDMTNGENRGFWTVSGAATIAPLTLDDAVEAQYIGIILDTSGANTDNDTCLRQIVLFGDDSKFAPLKKAINEALAYDNYIPYDPADWANLQDAIDAGDALLSTDATEAAIAEAAANIEDAIYNLGIRGGQQVISQNKMETNEWSVFTRWPEIKQAELKNASARIMTAADGVTNPDAHITKVEELFDGGIQMYGGNSGVWSDGYGSSGHGTTYVLYDFGEEVWINGADVATYDYKTYDGSGSKFIGEIFVEVSNDGKTFTPAGSQASAEFDEATLGTNQVRVTSTTFPAVKARYAKIGATKASGTVQYILMEMWVRGAKDFTNKINMTDNGDGTVSADILLDTDSDGARLFLATYDKFGNLDYVKMSKQTTLTNGVGELDVTANVSDGQIAKGMVFDSITSIKPLANAEIISKYTEADFTLSDMFTDGGVLQRGQEIAVYGTATTGTNVTVTVNGKEYKTIADGDGKWIVYADAVKAYDNVDISATDGKATFEAKDMLGGDVWLLSGQSNMMYTFDLLGSRAELPTNISEYSKFRFYNVPVVAAQTPATSIDSQWVDVSTLGTEEIADMSALGILSGIEFSDVIDAPIGIIMTARGGTSIEGYMSQDAFTGVVSKYWNNFIREGVAESSVYYNGMIAPVVPYGIKGVLWYQGCQNHANTTGNDYLELERAWVNDWRAKWNNDELPFIITMLAPYSGGNYAHIRDKQLALRDVEDNIGVISIMDLGDVDGTVGDNIHPIEKKEVARRLVLTASAVAYGDTTVKYLFPVMKSVTLLADGSVDVVFDNVYDGLKVKDGDSTVTGFKLKVGDKLVDAVGKITGTDTVNVKVDGVLAPNAVWYAYQGAINPELNLFNSEDLSAAPFYAAIN